MHERDYSLNHFYENVYIKLVKQNNFARFYNHGFYSDRKYIDYDSTDLNSELEANMYAQLIIDYNIETKNKTVLDIGCGLGFGSNVLKKYFQFKSVSAYDLVSSHIKFGKERFKGIDFFNYDSRKLNQLNQKYDIVISVESIRSYYDDDNFYCGLNNILNDGGKIAIATIVAGPKDKIYFDDINYYIEKFEKNNLKIIDCKNITDNVIKSCEYYMTNCNEIYNESFNNYDIDIIEKYFKLFSDKYIEYKLGITNYYNFFLEKHV